MLYKDLRLGLIFGCSTSSGEEDISRRDAYRVLVGRPEGKRQLGRPRNRWEDDIIIDFQEVGCRGNGLGLSGLGYWLGIWTGDRFF
jgi:hypothetical protein